MDLINQITDRGDIIGLIIVVVIIIVLFVIMYLISVICYPEDGKHSSYIGKGNQSNRTNDKGHNKGRTTNCQIGNSNQYNNGTANNKTTPVRSNQSSDDGWNNYAESERLKRENAREADNGNLNNVIEFDLENNDQEKFPVPISTKYEYLGAANGGQFLKLLLSDEKSFFMTWIENGVRKFEFHGNTEKALANINAIFDDVCEIEGKQNGATQIINVEPGVLNSHLKVEQRAKIKLV